MASSGSWDTMTGEPLQSFDGNKLNSLNLLEDCLGMIYDSRKNTLDTRRKDYERLQRRRGKQLRQVAREKVVIQHEDMDDLIEEEEEKQNSMYEELAAQMQDKIVEAKEAPGKRREARLKPELFKHTSSPAGKFVGLAATEKETQAVSLLNTLKTEVVAWWKEHKTRRTDDNFRCDFADYLTDKYLCQHLDRFESTKTISGIRKQASSIIETLASDCLVEDSCYEINEGMVPTGSGNTEINLTDNPKAVSPTKPPGQDSRRGEKIINIGLNQVIHQKKKEASDERYAVAAAAAGGSKLSTAGANAMKKQVSFNESAGMGSVTSVGTSASVKEQLEKEMMQQKYAEMKQKQSQSQAALRQKQAAEEDAAKQQQMDQMESNIDTIKQLLGSLNKK